MKLIVKNIFRDKEDHVTVYEPETILDVKDKERAADLVERGLCAEYKGRKAASVTPGEEIPEAPAEDVPETPVEDTPCKDTPEAPAEGEASKGKKA
ncbi:MAG: hypothetical protein IJ140_01390 [Prevotella sp.]|nr:hypothetical protein [Prevotella sp.]